MPPRENILRFCLIFPITGPNIYNQGITLIYSVDYNMHFDIEIAFDKNILILISIYLL